MPHPSGPYGYDDPGNIPSFETDAQRKERLKRKGPSKRKGFWRRAVSIALDCLESISDLIIGK